MSNPPPSNREPGRRGRQGETRALLIEATIELIRSEGLSALTTGRIASAAGIAQPGFYAHFRNIDECLTTALEQAVTAMQSKIREMRLRIFERYRNATNLTDYALLRANYTDTVQVMVTERTFTEIFLRYRRDPSLLGEFMAAVMTRARDELTEDIWRLVQGLGVPEAQHADIALWAEQIIALTLAAVEAVLDGRYESQDQVVEALTRTTYAVMKAQVRWSGIR
ncbi:MAG: TetR/AcrR family transcriptional regulator [Myxococcales bacterium]|nr:TetR/AcrR family transcriptional regulator [Myxococcales bacterium]